MPRTAEAVQAEMDKLAAAGTHHMERPMRALRAELKELGGWAPKKRAPRKRKSRAKAPKPAPIAEVRVDLASPAELPDFGPAPTADRGEWEFIQKCIAELPIPLKGMTSNMFKNMYDRVVLQVKMYRTMRGIHADLDSDGDFPGFGTLGLSSSDGRKKDAKPAPAPVEPVKTAEALGGETAAQMPIRKMPSRDELAKQFANKLPVHATVGP